jgi:hypothetical protein
LDELLTTDIIYFNITSNFTSPEAKKNVSAPSWKTAFISCLISMVLLILIIFIIGVIVYRHMKNRTILRIETVENFHWDHDLWKKHFTAQNYWLLFQSRSQRNWTVKYLFPHNYFLQQISQPEIVQL